MEVGTVFSLSGRADEADGTHASERLQGRRSDPDPEISGGSSPDLAVEGAGKDDAAERVRAGPSADDRVGDASSGGEPHRRGQIVKAAG